MIITDEKLLRRPCEDVFPEEFSNLIEVLENELNHANRLGKRGIGLACPQCNILKKAAIVRLGEVRIDLVNAKIANGYDQALFKDEGCLSFPNKNVDTLRYQEIYVTDNLVYPHSFVVTGLVAVVVAHEIEHYNSIVFLDHAAPKKVPIVISNKAGPNDPCPCGKVNPVTGKINKFKKCCSR